MNLHKHIRIKIKFYTVIIYLLCCWPVQAIRAQVKFYTQVTETTVSFPETFQVQYTVEGTKDIRDFVLPRFTDFKVEQVFDASNTTIITQQTTRMVETYSKVVVLSTKKKGRFTIAGATALINGKRMRSNSANIVVQNTPTPSVLSYKDVNTDEESELRPGEKVEDRIKKNLFLKTEINKTTCFVGEPLMVTYKAYTRLNATSQVTRRPSLTGFSVLEMVDNYDGTPTIEMLHGVPYYVNIIRKVQLFPLQEGSFTLDAAEIESTIHFTQTDRNGLSTPLEHTASIKSEPVTVTVKPLPAAQQAADFSGAVGHFTLSVQTADTTIHRGDLVKIQVIISGAGNISLLTPPHMQWPRGVDTADPMVKEDINRYVYPLTGSKIFEYSFAAPDTGTFTIPATQFHYYDPALQSYQVATSTPLTIQVLPGNKKAVVKEEAARQEGKPAVPRQLYWFGLVVVIIATWVIYQALQGKKKKQAPAIVIPAPSTPVAAVKPVPVPVEPVPDPLQNARQALEQGNTRLFYSALQQALWNVAAIKCQVAPSYLNKQNIRGRLLEKGASPALLDNFSAVLQECEWMLYTPTADTNDMTALLARAGEVVNDLHKI